jgi:hypothetical protein
MGTPSKVISVILRIGEFVSSIILVGLVSSFLYIVSDANVYADSRLIYTTVVASISAVFSLMFMLPFTWTFLAFPVDFVLFILSLVAFCLLEAVSYHFLDKFT